MTVNDNTNKGEDLSNLFKIKRKGSVKASKNLATNLTS